MFSLSSIAHQLHVSPETLRNWLKTEAAEDASVETFQRLANERLTRRANKSRAASAPKVPFSKEFSDDPSLWKNVQNIERIFSGGAPLEPLLFCAVQKYIEQRKQATGCILNEIQTWKNALSPNDLNLVPKFDVTYAGSDDFPGILYERLSESGEKTQRGAFYTPPQLVANLMKDVRQAVENKKNADFSTPFFLDPCCGTGIFLRQARRTFHLPFSHLFGCDTDPIAVRIARLNLLLDAAEETEISGKSETSERTFERTFEKTTFKELPQIFCADGLKSLPAEFPQTFHLVATNPPWGSVSNVSGTSNASNVSGTSDTSNILGVSNTKPQERFSAFLLHSVQNLLIPGGLGAFLLPESFLNIKIHTSIRSRLLETTRILKIRDEGRPFTSVFTSVVSLLLEVKNAENSESGKDGENSVENHTTNHPIQISDSHSIPQTWFLSVPQRRISLKTTPEDAVILGKMTSVPHLTLQNHARWGLGIITGNNAKFLTAVSPPASFETEENPSKWEPILRGPNISPYKISKPDRWIRLNPSQTFSQQFQQSVPEEAFRVPEKIVYRFITSRPTFALDDAQRLTLNSVNFLIPTLPGFSTQTVLAFLNSYAFQFLFRHWFFTHKILRGDLEELPFPKISQKINNKIEKLAGEIFSKPENCDKINEIIFTAFHLTRQEAEQIRRELEK